MNVRYFRFGRLQEETSTLTDKGCAESQLGQGGSDSAGK